MIQIVISAVETLWPGSKPYLDFALQYIDQVKLEAIIKQAISDWRAGMSFVDILKDLLSKALPAGVTFPGN